MLKSIGSSELPVFGSMGIYINDFPGLFASRCSRSTGGKFQLTNTVEENELKSGKIVRQIVTKGKRRMLGSFLINAFC